MFFTYHFFFDKILENLKSMTHEKVVAYLLQERLAIFQKTENMKLSRDTIAIPHISVGELLKNSHTCIIPCTSSIFLLSLAKALFSSNFV